MKVYALDPNGPDPELVTEIASLLKQDGTIAYPTDTLYGLGADAFNPVAYQRIGILKGRDGEKPFPHIIDRVGRLTDWEVRLGPAAEEIIEAFWPGPISLIVQDTGKLPSYVLGPGRTLCVRVPDNRIARDIAGSLGGLLAATSANPAGHPPACCTADAIGYFRGEIDAVIDGGPSRRRLPSTIVDVTGQKVVILREGAIPADEVRAVIDKIQKGS